MQSHLSEEHEQVNGYHRFGWVDIIRFLLPEEEKLYDRNTCLETLKFIMGKGFHIVKVAESSSDGKLWLEKMRERQ